MSKMNRVRSGDLPRSLREEIGLRLHWHSTPLILERPDRDGKLQPSQAGSGTFVAVEGINGILTAQHVSELLRGDGELGLPLEPRKPHAFRIDLAYLSIIEVASPVRDSDGPDLAFIVLPEAKVGEIQARQKFFYPLSRHRAQVLSQPLEFDEGAWYVCGVPHERTTEEPPEGGFERIVGYQALCFLVGARPEFTKGDYDYIDVQVEYLGPTQPPEQFFGVSGGGLWQIPLGRTEAGELKATSYILSGVAFCQFDRQDHKKTIRCHGRRSVYRKVYDAVMEEHS